MTKFALVNKMTNGIVLCSDDKDVDFPDYPLTDFAWLDQSRKQQYAEINQQYTTEIANIREAIRLVLDTGKDATALRTKLAAKQAEYKAALLAV